jgi:hypothetical protein
MNRREVSGKLKPPEACLWVSWLAYSSTLKMGAVWSSKTDAVFTSLGPLSN